MNRLVTTIGVVGSLWLIQSCSPSPRADQTSATTETEQQEEHSMNHIHHDGHSVSGTSNPINASVVAKLTPLATITAHAPVPLGIDVQDSTGKAIAKFDTFQEKQMHLIMVSNDFQDFQHLHPTYKQNGRFEVTVNFPQPGGYTLFSDYKPAEQEEQVSVLNVTVPGTRPVAPGINLSRTKTTENTKVNLTLSELTLKAGQEITLTFNLQDVTENQPVQDLQPYLGERGHLVILHQSPTLDRASYIHAHAMKQSPTGQVQFMTQFPQPGKYKLWGQFNRSGKIITADFWVNVI